MMNQWLANQGYVVFSVNYRSGIGYGKSFRTAPNTGARGNAEYQDVVAGAASTCRDATDVDPKRVGIWGLSYGGLLTVAGARPQLGHLRRWRGLRRRAPLHQRARSRERRVQVVRDLGHRQVEVAGAARPRRRRPQRGVHADHRARATAARARASPTRSSSSRTTCTSRCSTAGGSTRSTAWSSSSTSSCGTRAGRTMRRAHLALAVLLAVALGLGLAAHPAVPAAPFFFIQLTDPQFGMTASNAGFEQETANLEFAVATVNRLHPAFVVVTGDLVNRPGDERSVGRVPADSQEAESGDPRLLDPGQPRRRQRADAGIACRLHEAIRPRPLCVSSSRVCRDRHRLVPGPCAPEGAGGGSRTRAMAAGRVAAGAHRRRPAHRRLPAPPAVPEGRRGGGQLRRHSDLATRPVSDDVQGSRRPACLRRALPPERGGAAMATSRW